MKSIAEMSQLELAAYIQTKLREHDLEVVLSGGASVDFYTHSAYVSHDIDQIDNGLTDRRTIRETMYSIGFELHGRHYKHPNSQFLVEFPLGPPSVGSELVQEIHSFSLETGVLRILSPTDTVKDRLLGYFYWGDQQSLEQAILITQAQSINLNEIERWVKSEGQEEAFRSIKAWLSSPAGEDKVAT